MKMLEVVHQLQTKLGEVIMEKSEFLGETTIRINKENLLEVLSYLKNDSETGYTVLIDLTAVDYLEPEQYSKIVYWLHNPVTMERIRVVLCVKREETLPSVVSLWEGADWYERELFDMFGVQFDGHPDLKRILMPDDWVGHPMRRDYPLTEEPVEFVHGAKPKIPSEIINIRKKQKYL